VRYRPQVSIGTILLPAFRVLSVAVVLAACVACSRPPITEEPLFREPVSDLSRVLTDSLDEGRSSLERLMPPHRFD
jgi:hypothetical protein